MIRTVIIVLIRKKCPALCGTESCHFTCTRFRYGLETESHESNPKHPFLKTHINLIIVPQN